MMESRSLLKNAILLPACACAIACADPDADVDRDLAATEIVQRCDEFLDILCQNTYQCGEEAQDSRDSLRELFGATDESSCRSAMEGFLGAICLSGADSVAGGRSRYDAIGMDGCVEASREASCVEYFVASGEGTLPLGSVCEAFPFVTGVQAEGEACMGDFECTDGGVCEGADPDFGVCVVLEAGDACEFNGDCDSDDLYCDHPGNDFDTSDRGPGVCAPRASAGEPCDEFWACAGDLHCDNVNGFDPETGIRLPGICIERLGTGAPCDEGADCVSSVCEGADFGGEGTCA